ncbi:hypothetical protein ACWFRM_32485 [Streptomyces sp. NPDC055144]
MAELDLALVEVLLELPPFFGRDVDVLAFGTEGSAVVEELLVVLDDALGEDRDVTLCGLKVPMSEQGRADVVGRLPLTMSVAKSRRKSCGVNLVPAKAGFVLAISSQLRPIMLSVARSQGVPRNHNSRNQRWRSNA